MPKVKPAAVYVWALLLPGSCRTSANVELNHAPPECSTVITLNSGAGVKCTPFGAAHIEVAVSLWQSGCKQPERPSLQLAREVEYFLRGCWASAEGPVKQQSRRIATFEPSRDRS